MNEMTKYELMMVTVPTAAGESLVSRFEKIIKDAGATVKVTNMGRKKLGYPIHKLTDADYFVMDFEAEAGKVPPILSRLRLEQEDLLRYMLIKKKLFKPNKRKGRMVEKSAEAVEAPKVAKVTVVTKKASTSQSVKESKTNKTEMAAKSKKTVKAKKK